MDAGDLDDLDDGIDWADLQEFFFSDLEPKLPEMQRLIEAGDCTTLARIGHSLKGSGGGVKLPRFTELGKVLEDAGKAADLTAIEKACAAIRDEYLIHKPEAAGDLSPLFRTRKAA